MRKLLILLFLPVLFGAAVLVGSARSGDFTVDQAAAVSGTLAQQVQALMTRYLEDANVVGVSVGVERGTEVLVRGGWGMADRESKRPATADTSYRLGSVSKQFTAALIMRLVERGKIALDDLVEGHLPTLPRKWRGITVRQLLNHTSGVPDFTDTGSKNWPKSLTPDGLLGLVADDGLHFAPGTKYEYSNTNYAMLAMMAEKHYARPLATILDDEIAKPLGMKTTRFCEDAYGSNGQAQPYVREGDRVVVAPYRSVTHSFGAGGICSTVADVAVWNRALHSGKVVNSDSYKLMTTPTGAATAERYGFGLIVRPIGARTALFHGGLVPGFITVNAWVPPEGVSVTIVTNTSPTPQTPALFRDLTRLAFGENVTIVEPSTGPAPDVETLKKYAGTYTIQVPGRPLDIKFWVDGKSLMGQAAGQSETRLRPAGAHSFGTASDWTVRFTFADDKGVFSTMQFEQGGQKFQAVRKR